MSTDTLDRTDERTTTRPSEPGDHDVFSHYVKKEALEAAILEGTSCVALCGKVWLPTKDAMRFPVCPECKEIYEGLGE